ncbi:hypothetical protein [Burkholderia multivorans]|uniref:hypothetical protein n=1 Tax=Burkholderia multivorans TaxID=87883 RepID=UPI0018DD73A8|nr:hypothetical protein [Burkholderia multivorans]MBH9662034.1 hypothetical protein [Burkholderia multivorans]
MKEPIMSREEVKALYSKHIANPYDLPPPRHVEAFVADYEAAVLERVCGEPVAWMVLATNTGLPCEVTLHKSETEALRQDCVIPLYVINRSKS